MDEDPDGRRVSFVGLGAAVFVLVLVVAAIVVLIVKPGSGHGGGPSSNPQAATPGSTANASSTRTSATSTTAAAAKPGVCSLPAGDQAVPSASQPRGVSWGQVGSMSVPQAPRTYGPQWQRGGWSSCFAHNPTGALLSAINLWAEGTTIPDGRVMKRYAVGAPSAAFKPKTTLSAQFAGYKYDSYTADKATMEIVLQGTQGALGAVRTTMVWVGGKVDDWRYQFPPGGNAAGEKLDGTSVEPPYVAWSDFGG